jgi:hypothetical protein
VAKSYDTKGSVGRALWEEVRKCAHSVTVVVGMLHVVSKEAKYKL